MMLSLEQQSLLWLSSAEVSASRVHNLIREHGSARAVWDNFAHISFQPRCAEILTKLHDESAIAVVCDRLEKCHVKLLFYTDEVYPQWLKCIDDFPYLLYYAGRLSCLNAPMVGVVGTRKPSEYGKQIAHTIGRGLAEGGVTVVSGLARGIDAAVHQGALDAEGCTIGVLGCGINTPYPPEHTPLLRRIAGGKGLIISEYPLDAEPIQYHFPYRNRIISGLSCAVVFVEGQLKSGGMHTVNAALAQGREVFAIPGRVGTQGAEGPHAILREGTRIATSAEDILDDLGIVPPGSGLRQTVRRNLSPAEQDIIDRLRIEPMTVEQLALSLQMDVGEAITNLSVMEINGLITREAGNVFSALVDAQD